MLSAACGLPILLPLAASAITVVNDTFEENVHPNAFRTVPALTGIPFYSSRATNTNPMAIASDTTFGSRALVVEATEQQIVAPLGGTISLANLGDTLTLSFKVRITNYSSTTVLNSGFRFGIHGSGGTPVTGDNFGTVIQNDSGYGVISGINEAPGTGATVFNEGASADTILGGTRTFLTSSAAGANFTDGLAHTFSLTLTRAASSINFSLSFDGGTAITGSNSTNIRTSFDELSFSTGYGTSVFGFAIDDVLLEASNFTPIPEPAVAGLAGFGLLLLLKRRK